MRSIRNRKADIQKEITLLSEVHDRSIVKFIGASDHPPFVILTELMQGGSLRDYLQSLRPGRIDPKQAIRYSLEIAKAMHFLHERNIVHRDLHPGNVLFTRSQERLKVDFGEAWGKSLREKLNFENKSLAWVAPEVRIIFENTKLCCAFKFNDNISACVLSAFSRGRA
ncbi:serine/threonine-protein kinase STY46-like [Macadamia integrifolia]|uniref:serine/threonine-protein kinase STY46-like n=1 Tax=Macadamia integrifolia TaxID=60698 RepID=UPI001C4E6930|nr:serine/threonine-protein kinase STY46-like [Macadamia integrifolia]